MSSPETLLFGSIIGFVGGIVVSAAGFYLSDRWVAITGLVGATAFGLAVAYFWILV